MHYVWLVIVLMVAIVAIGTIVSFKLIKGRKQRNGVIAAFSYLAFSAALFYIDVVSLEQDWAIPIYIVCFVAVPLAVYYVVYSLSSEAPEKKRRPSDGTQRIDKPARAAEKADGSLVVDMPSVEKPASNQARTFVDGRGAEVVDVADEDEVREIFVDRVSSFKRQGGQHGAHVSHETVETGPLKPVVPEFLPLGQPDATSADAELPMPDRSASRTSSSEVAAARQAVLEQRIAMQQAVVAREAAEAQKAAMQRAAEREEAMQRAAEREEAVRQEAARVAAQADPEPLPIAQQEMVEQDHSADTDFEKYYAKAVALREKGHMVVAATLFAQSAESTTDPHERTKALFDELTCYVKADDRATARTRAESLGTVSGLNDAERMKLKALLTVLAVT